MSVVFLLLAAGAFLSTLSLRRATVHYDNYNLHCVISIHALLAESDGFSYFYIIKITNFYPRSPCGERPITITITCTVWKFLSTLSLRRATAIHNAKIDKHDDFYPRSPCGERRRCRAALSATLTISIHALLAESDSKSAQNSGALLRI